MLASLSRRTETRRWIAILTGSALLHVAVLAILGLNAIQRLDGGLVLQSPFVIEMTPRRHGDGETAKGPAPSQTHRLDSGASAPSLIASDQASAARSTPSPPAPDRPSQVTTLPAGPAVIGDSAAIARALRNGATGCHLGRSDPADRDRCERALAEAAGRARPINGSGDPARDARFAAQGAEALARYESLRAPLKPYSRAEPCPGGPSPSDPCAVALQGRIWSSTDGWLPDLPRPHR